MKPMLAFMFQDKRRHLTFPCHVQPKLNGIRMLYRDGTLQSRSHGRDEPKLWAENRLLDIRNALAGFDTDLILDGELYVHGWSLQQINAAAAVNMREDKISTAALVYNVFDCVNTKDLSAPFCERWSLLKFVTPLTKAHRAENIQLVDTFVAAQLSDAESHFAHFKSLGYEGAIYRQSNAPYGLESNCTNKENRWPCLLKRKDWLDDEFRITDFNLTTGSLGERGFRLHCVTKEGRPFAVGSGLSDAEVSRYALNPPIGQTATVKFEMFSDSLIPLKPTILEINEW